MQAFLGTKLIQATPMTRGEYNAYRGWDAPDGEEQAVPGYLVEYLDGGKPNHPHHTGYISWSPMDVFAQSYRPVDGLSFGLALDALKMGKRVARKGWNGKGMFLFLLPAQDGIPTRVISDPALRQVVEDELGGGTFDAYGSIRMFTADKKILTGWTPNGIDCFSEDWEILE